MNKIISNIHFCILILFFKKHTLRGQAWKRIRSDSSNVYQYKKEQQLLRMENFINSPVSAFCLSLVTLLFLGGLCFYSLDFSNTVLEDLNFLVFDKKQSEDQLNLSLTISAGLIAISFVVIGFLFEVVKDKTQVTYYELFRATKLYIVLSFSFAAVLFLIILNGIKYSVDSHTVGNLAVLSIYILMAVNLFIAFLFLQVLKFFSPKSIIHLSNGIILNLAKRQIVREVLVEKSRIIHKEICEDLDMKENHPLDNFSDPIDYNIITLNNREGYVKDVNLYLLKRAMKGVVSSSDKSICGKYSSIYQGKFLSVDYPVAFIPDSLNVGWLSKVAVRNSFFFVNKITINESFLNEKKTLINRIKLASERGDIELLDRQFETVEELYKIYYSKEENR